MSIKRIAFLTLLATLLGLFANDIAKGQQDPARDLDSDGVPDLMVFGEQWSLAVLRGPDYNTEIVRYVGSSSQSLFGFTYCWVGDLNSDGHLDLLVCDPSESRPGLGRGTIYAFDGSNGAELWSWGVPEGEVLALGIAGVPANAQNRRADVLVRLTRADSPQLVRAALLDGGVGKLRRLATTTSFSKLVRAHWSLQVVANYADANKDGQISDDDMGIYFNQFLDSNDLADVNRDFDLNFDDVDTFTASFSASALGPDYWSATTDELVTGTLWNAKSDDGQWGAFDYFGESAHAGLVQTQKYALPETSPSEEICNVSIADAVSSLVKARAAEDLDVITMRAVPCHNRVPRPGYTPSSNGCGPAGGGTLHWLLCQNPYNSTLTSACNDHDICYGTCNSSKAACDGLFLANMLAACSSTYGGWGIDRYSCAAAAADYYTAVHYFGNSAFEAAQSAACICCDQPSPNPGCP